MLPPLPEKLNVAVVTMANKNAENSDVIEKRRRRLESFLNRIAAHPILSVHAMFLRFLEVETWVCNPFLTDKALFSWRS